MLQAGEIDLKSESGERRVPILALLRDMLVEYLMTQSELKPTDRTFTDGRRSTSCGADKLQMRADDAWGNAGLERVTLHVGRHTFASAYIAAGVASGRFNPKAVSEFMGHSSIKVTDDVYGHLMPAVEAEAASMVNDYLTPQLAAAEEDVRQADFALTGAPTGA